MRKKVSAIMLCEIMLLMMTVSTYAVEEIIEDDDCISYDSTYAEEVVYEENVVEEGIIVSDDMLVSEDGSSFGNYEYDVLDDETACITGYFGSAAGDLEIPATIDGYPVTVIGDNAFEGCDFTGCLTIPDSVTEIGVQAFSNCGFTGNLIIPEGVTTIGAHAFSGCKGFTGSLTIPDSVTEIGYGAFYCCEGFTGSLTIPDSVTEISAGAFWDCRGFTGSLTIPNRVTKIGNNAFRGCNGFTGSLAIGNSVTQIGQFAFGDCKGFTGDLTIPDSVTTIDYGSFIECSGFTGSLTIGNSVTTVGYSAFEGCRGFTGSLTIPDSVTTLGEGAFHNCTGLSKIINNSIQWLMLPSDSEHYWTIEGSDIAISEIMKGVAVKHDIDYRISYVLNGGKNSIKNPTTYKKTTADITLSNPSRVGYTFAGWYADSKYTNKITVIKKGTTGNKTLYAKWSINTYKITYKLNGGKNNSKNPASYKVTTSDITLKNPTRKGYTFKGWYTDNKLTKKITAIKKGSTGDKTVYAKWEANKYTIKYNANGGKGKMKNQSMTYDKKAKLTKNSFTRKGYKFLGWSTDKKAKKAKYKNAAEVKNLTNKSKGTVTLYAVWKKK